MGSDENIKIIKSTAIIGMGALGLLYGSLTANSLGMESVRFLMDADRVKRYKNRTFTVCGRPMDFIIQDGRDAQPADLLIIAVKEKGLSSALETAANAVGPDTTIISVMNGVISEDIISERFGKDHVIHAVAQGMDAMHDNGSLSYTRPGELRIGTPYPENLPRLESLEEFLTRAGIPFTREENILRRIWSKFMLNTGINQTCMIYETGYGGALEPGPARETLTASMREAILVANAEGIDLNEQDMEDYMKLIATLSYDGMPSMRQDGLAGRPTEVDLFAGTVIRLAEKHGLSVPVNRMIYRRVREMEAGYSSGDGRQATLLMMSSCF